jgi:carbamoyltransferase
LIYEFGDRTGVPVVMNTSFNLRGEPIVCTPTDAIRNSSVPAWMPW